MSISATNGANGSKKRRLDDEMEQREIKIKIKGSVVLVNFDHTSILNILHGFKDQKVSLNLISAVNGDPENENRGRLGPVAYLETKPNHLLYDDEDELKLNIGFYWEEEIGIPGAFLVRNDHSDEFFLKTLTLDVPGHDSIHFVCNSWICPHKDRLFFSNKAYLPDNTPEPLRKYREKELIDLRGNGEGKLEKHDRIYDYACYNDLGDDRPVLGGCKHRPYPRRIRTGRELIKPGCNIESRLPLLESLSIYVPRDEQFSPVKHKEFLKNSLKAIAHSIIPELSSLFHKEFRSFEEVLDLYKGIELPDGPLHSTTESSNPLHVLKAIFRCEEAPFKFQEPHVIREDSSAWMSDEEFARQMLAGVNPVVIRRVEKFPIKSAITEEHIINNLDGMTRDEAIVNNKLFILDYHDALMPYVRRINETNVQIYASRTLLFFKKDGTLRPIAIELSLPHPIGDEFGEVSQVYTPAEKGIERSLWQLAKAYVAVNDSGYHQLISHWLHTHAAIEPIVIATNRQLSVLHPIYKLLHPHFKDTLFINALARQTLINAGGILELTVFPGKYALEMSSEIYKNWKFTDQALPIDLINRGMADDDKSSPHGLRLIIEDYPFAVDGLEIWSAIKQWVESYCGFYYSSNASVQQDYELQSWWREIRELGHGDKKEESWWLSMQTREELVQTCSTIIWIASALHAAINFGQYPYGGFLPNRPPTSRRLMPEIDSEEYKKLELNPEYLEELFLKTVTEKPVALLGISLIEVLSKHASDEEYLDQRIPEWTYDEKPKHEFKKFQEKLKDIGERIVERNKDMKLKNRSGPVNMPYTLLFPTSKEGLTCQGIPNSVSI